MDAIASSVASKKKCVLSTEDSAIMNIVKLQQVLEFVLFTKDDIVYN